MTSSLELLPGLVKKSTLTFYRAMLCIRGTSHGPVSVCPSVTSRSSTKMAKHRITQTTPRDIPGTLVFWSQRSSRNSTDRGHPLQGHQMQVGWVKIGDFRQITGYISKRYKIDAWFLLKSNRKVGWVKIGDFRQITGYISKRYKIDAPSNGGIADNLEWPLSAPNYPQFVHFAPILIPS